MSKVLFEVLLHNNGKEEKIVFYEKDFEQLKHDIANDKGFSIYDQLIINHDFIVCSRRYLEPRKP